MKRGDIVLLTIAALFWLWLVRTGRHDDLKAAASEKGLPLDTEKKALGTFGGGAGKKNPSMFELRGRVGAYREPRSLTPDEVRRSGLRIIAPGQVTDRGGGKGEWTPRLLQGAADRIRELAERYRNSGTPPFLPPGR